MRVTPLVCALVIACHSGPKVAAAPKAPPLSVVTVGDFQYTASNGGANVWGPLEVQVTVKATNTTDKPAILDVLGGNCAVLIRIFTSPARTGKPLYDASSGAECYVKPLHEKVAPHESYIAQSGRYGPGIDVPAGRYYLSALIVPADPEKQKIEVPAGEFTVRR
jgi:hypothetical protein